MSDRVSDMADVLVKHQRQNASILERRTYEEEIAKATPNPHAGHDT